MKRGPRFPFARDAAVATGVVAGLYGLAIVVRFAPLQIPGYLLILGFDGLERVFGSAGSAYQMLFAAYLLGLGLVGAAVSRAVRRITNGTELPGWRPGMAGALAVVGALSLLFASGLLFGTPQREPVLITGTSGLVLLVLAGWLIGAFDVETARPAGGDRE